MSEYRGMVHDENHKGGIVVDVRGNMGGLGGMTMGMASELAKEASVLGVMTTKGSELKFFVNENFDPVECPVAVLVDECSISSAEIFSGGLQDLKLARLFGARTAGLALPSVVVKLPNGDGFQYAMADYHSASGKTLEMDGVTPDEEIPLSRDLLLNNDDPVLRRALEWIKQQQTKQ
jgi:carboxyl-terminal processing protease